MWLYVLIARSPSATFTEMISSKSSLQITLDRLGKRVCEINLPAQEIYILFSVTQRCKREKKKRKKNK